MKGIIWLWDHLTGRKSSPMGARFNQVPPARPWKVSPPPAPPFPGSKERISLKGIFNDGSITDEDIEKAK